ncbi:MAG TPA: PBP1A family penicillin-binding protein [Kofleriaceae bacterium]|nr:PBP1A family penicillin-binding protein [Kofleriaceae bacterium]
MAYAAPRRQGLLARLGFGAHRGGPPRSRKQKIFMVLKWGAIAGLALSAIFAATIALLFWIWGSDSKLPNIAKLSDYHPAQVSRVLASDGSVIGEIYTQRRTYVPYERIPKSLIHALVSAEDADFFEHEGIDYLGMVRALFVNLKEGETVQGASTITQQVVKNLLLSRERTLKRKVQEIILSRRLESALSKDEILTLYANEIYFGHGRYGVQEAARFYFGKDVDKLDIGEAAMLAGLPQGPEILSPKKPENRDRAKRRQMYVLEQMVKNGYLEAKEAQKYIREPIRIISEPYPKLGLAPEWVDVARAALVEKVGTEEVDRAGVTVVATLDLDVQTAAQAALRAGLRAYDKRQKYGVPVSRLKKEKVAGELAALKKRLPRGGPVAGEEYRAVVLEAHDDGGGELVVDLGDWKASVLLGGRGDERFNPDGKKASARFAAGDVVRVMVPRGAGASPRKARSEHVIELAGGPEGAVVVIEPRTRRVLAVVGGYAFQVGDFNRATMARRQAGSTFKPFVYAAAIDGGEMTAATLVNDAPEVYDLWKPENHEKGEFEGPVRIRHALAKSINTVAIRVAHDVGPERVAKMANDMGVTSPLPTTLSIALGSGEVTPLELTNAFATFATGGKVAPPQVLRKIGDQAVDPVAPSQVIRPEVAYVVTDMMRSVVTEGTAAAASKALKMDVVGKTGTSNSARDAWFVGMTGELVVGVWVGFDDFKRPLGKGEAGGKSALPVFIDLMKKVGGKGGGFTRPAGVVDAVIDRKTGLLAPEGAPEKSTLREVFLAGTAPTEVAPAAGDAAIDTSVQDQYEDVYGDDPQGGAEGDPKDQ